MVRMASDVAVWWLLLVFLVVMAVNLTQAQYPRESSTSELASNILGQIRGHLSTASHSVQGRMYGGCTDSFSIFGFLAFLLALLDLILELQAMDAGGGRRRRRQAHGTPLALVCQEEEEEVQEAASASYSLLRGFLNTLAAEEPECANRFLCEAAEEAAAAGPLGEVVAKVASLNAASWLLKVNSSLYAEVGEAGQVGALGGACALEYSQCFALPDSYRHPGVFRGPQLPSHIYQPVLDEVMDVMRDTLL